MLILASSSPRRKELLKKLDKDFTVIPAEVDERSLDGVYSPMALPIEESRLKAYYVHALYPNDRVLAADTIVLLDGQILGKPKNEKDAIEMLKKERGKKQSVITGYTYLSPRREINRSVRTYVYFNDLSDEEIEEYVRKFKPLDKAGAYGIQDDPRLVSRLEGSYDNVMGLPTEDLEEHVFKKHVHSWKSRL
jgi:septum formation protein